MKKTGINAVTKKIRKFKDGFFEDTGLTSYESFCMEMKSDGELYIKGVKDVPLVSDETVIIKCIDITVNIQGEKLILGKFSANDTSVCGEIKTIEFWKAGK